MSELINGLGTTPASRAEIGVGRKAAAKARKVIDGTADRLSAGVTITADKAQRTAERAADKAHEATARAAQGVQKLTRTVDPVVAEQPYVAIAGGAAFGLLLGLAFAPRPRVIYVKSH